MEGIEKLVNLFEYYGLDRIEIIQSEKQRKSTENSNNNNNKTHRDP